MRRRGSRAGAGGEPSSLFRLEKRLRAAYEGLSSHGVSRRHAPAPIHGPARPGDLRSNLVDPARAGRLLGWHPTVALDAGLAETAAWFAARAGA